jgi:NAD(P) transhydrogenase subunit alpha
VRESADSANAGGAFQRAGRRPRLGGGVGAACTPCPSLVTDAPLGRPSAPSVLAGGVVNQDLIFSMLFALMLATFVGFAVIQNVSRLLHTPLMSLTNAISAIAVVGSILIAGEQKDTLTTLLGAVAVFASITNIVSGFLITDRMLKMFKEKGPKS